MNSRMEYFKPAHYRINNKCQEHYINVVKHTTFYDLLIILEKDKAHSYLPVIVSFFLPRSGYPAASIYGHTCRQDIQQ
jgi:hypothetical protein